MRSLLCNRMLVLQRFIKINSSNLLSENINDLPENVVSQAVLDSAARSGTTLSLELRQAQLNHESVVQQERDMSYDLVTKRKMHFGQQRAHMVHEHHQVDEGEAQIHYVRHQMESEQRASFMILESVSQERDLVRQEALHLHDNCDRSEQAALLPGEDVDEFTFSLVKLDKQVSTLTTCMKEASPKATRLLL